MPRVTLQRLIMYTKSPCTNFIGAILFPSFTYSKNTSARIFGSCFQKSICGKSFYREILAVVKKVFLCMYIKASVNRQGLSILKWFFLHFHLILLQVKEQI